MFLLGFVGDFIINIYLDPVDIIVSTLDHDETSAYYVLEDEDVGWLEHFAKGFASLGILGFAKVFFANPLRWWNFRGTGTLGTNRAGTTGRDRVANTTWVAIFIGVGMMLYVSRVTTSRAGDTDVNSLCGKAYAHGVAEFLRKLVRKLLTCKVKTWATMMKTSLQRTILLLPMVLLRQARLRHPTTRVMTLVLMMV